LEFEFIYFPLHILNGDQIWHELIHLMTGFSIEQVLYMPK